MRLYESKNFNLLKPYLTSLTNREKIFSTLFERQSTRSNCHAVLLFLPKIKKSKKDKNIPPRYMLLSSLLLEYSATIIVLVRPHCALLLLSQSFILFVSGHHFTYLYISQRVAPVSISLALCHFVSRLVSHFSSLQTVTRYGRIVCSLFLGSLEHLLWERWKFTGWRKWFRWFLLIPWFNETI